MNNHINYCFKHNYSYKFCTNYTKPASQVNNSPFYLGTWSKPGFILTELSSNLYDYIFWIDSDSIFTNFNLSFDDLVLTGKDITFSGDYSDVFNGGHLLVKNTEFSFDFISKWEASRFINFSKYKDQISFDITQDGYALGDQTLFNALLNCNSLNPEELIVGFNTINGFDGNHNRNYDNWRYLFSESDSCLENIYQDLINKKIVEHIQIVPQRRLNSYLDSTSKQVMYHYKDPIIHFVSTSKSYLENRNIIFYKLIEFGIYISPLRVIIRRFLRKLLK